MGNGKMDALRNDYVHPDYKYMGRYLLFFGYGLVSHSMDTHGLDRYSGGLRYRFSKQCGVRPYLGGAKKYGEES